MKEEKNKEEKEEESAEAIGEPEVEEEAVEELSHEEEKKDEITEEPAEPEKEATAEIEEEEEAKPPSRKEKEKKKEKEEEEIVEERTYTVPLGKAWIMPPRKRAPRAMRILKAFVTKHMKLEKPKEGEEEVGEEPAQLVISNEVNERIWERSIEKPPRKIRVRATKDKEGNVTVYLAEGD
jgi:large subunit ribosomal protein L31e